MGSVCRNESQPTTDRRRWCRVTPDWLFVGLLALVGFLWLSERYSWFAFNEKKGWTVLIAVAAVCVIVLVALLWFVASLLFRRQFQFSIRSLLVLAVAVVIPASWLAVSMRQAQRQQRAVEVLEELPGWVRYDFQRRSYARKTLAPWRLVKLLGKDFFANVEGACLGGRPSFTDAELAHVGALSGLKDLSVEDAEISSDGLKHLQGMTSLRHLGLCGAPITDAGLEYLGGLTSLESLWLPGTKIADAGLVHLQELPHLKELWLSDTKITDVGLIHLQEVASLRELEVYGTQVTDNGVRKFRAALPDCETYH